jgi:hypothetical protein
VLRLGESQGEAQREMIGSMGVSGGGTVRRRAQSG